MMARSTRRAVSLAICAIGLGCTPSSSTEVAEGSQATAQPATPSTADAGSEAEAGATEEPNPEAETEGAGETGQEVELPEPGEPGPKPPEGYGVFKFPTEPPSEDQLLLHGAAGFEVVAVYAGPSKDSTRLGFLRIGTRMRVGEKAGSDDECKKGWHALEGGGYACASKGLMVGERPPFMSYEPKPPRLAEPYPYDWAYIREWNTPMWWQVPTKEELVATKQLRAEREFEREVADAIARGEPPPQPKKPPAPPPKPAPPAEDGGDESGDGGGIASLPAPDGEEPASDDGSPEPASSGDDGGAEAPAPPAPAPPEPAPPEPEEEKEPIHIPFSPTPWLEKGYYLSLGESIREDGKSYWQTARGGVVEKAKAHPVEPKDFQGAELFEGVDFPVGFVMVNDGTKLLTLGDDDKLHATGKRLEKRTFLDLGEEVEISGHSYFSVLPYPPPEAAEDGESGEDAESDKDVKPALFVRADVMRLPQLQPMPKGLDPWDRWIDVDITKQLLVAYEGPRPAYVTLVSTGKKGTDEEPFDTPTGRFRIRSKQITSNMDGTTATDGNYAIQDVPWVMYFQGSYALHGAFWHRTFGYVRSHGCVNLGPSDARWLFFWTTPFVPETWHGAAASDDNPGTTIVIRKSEES